MEAGPLGRELDEHRDRAVALRPRLGEEAVGDLALHHHAPELDRGQPVEALDDERRGDLVRQVRDELRRRRVELVERERQRVPEDELDVVAAGERSREAAARAPVELDRVDERHAVGEVAR